MPRVPVQGKPAYLTLAQTRGIKGPDFGKADTDRNGKLSRTEYDAAPQTPGQSGHRAQPHARHVAPAPKAVPAIED